MRELIASLSSARKKFLDSGILTKEEFNRLVEIDPSPTKKYLEWVCSEFSKHAGLNFHFLENLLEDLYYLEGSNLIPGFDINRFKGGLLGMEEMIKEKLSGKIDRSLGLHRIQKGKDYELIYQNNDWFVFKILSYKGSRTLGSGTPWCVVANEDHYDNYIISQGLRVFFFFISKNAPITKYAALVPVNYGNWTENKYFRDIDVTDDSNHEVSVKSLEESTGIPISIVGPHRSAPPATQDINAVLKKHFKADNVKTLPDGRRAITVNKEHVIFDGWVLAGLLRDESISVSENVLFVGDSPEIVVRNCKLLSLDFLEALKVPVVSFYESSFEGKFDISYRRYSTVTFSGCHFEKASLRIPVDRANYIVIQNCYGTRGLDIGAEIVTISNNEGSFEGTVRVVETLSVHGEPGFKLGNPYPNKTVISLNHTHGQAPIVLNGSNLTIVELVNWSNYSGDSMSRGWREISSSRPPSNDYSICPVVKGFHAVNLVIFLPIMNLSDIQADYQYLSCARVYTSDLSKLKRLGPQSNVTMNIQADGPLKLPKGDPGCTLRLSVVGLIPWLFGSNSDPGTEPWFSTFKGKLHLKIGDLNWSNFSKPHLKAFQSFIQSMISSGMDPDKTRISFNDMNSSLDLNGWLDQIVTELGPEESGQDIVSSLFRGVSHV